MFESSALAMAPKYVESYNGWTIVVCLKGCIEQYYRAKHDKTGVTVNNPNLETLKRKIS